MFGMISCFGPAFLGLLIFMKLFKKLTLKDIIVLYGALVTLINAITFVCLDIFFGYKAVIINFSASPIRLVEKYLFFALISAVIIPFFSYIIFTKFQVKLEINNKKERKNEKNN